MILWLLAFFPDRTAHMTQRTGPHYYILKKRKETKNGTLLYLHSSGFKTIEPPQTKRGRYNPCGVRCSMERTKKEKEKEKTKNISPHEGRCKLIFHTPALSMVDE